MSPGEQLRVYFESRNLTMQAFAQKLGTNRVSLRHWLAGTGFPEVAHKRDL
jgi:transcriptional regulator with XRE-family HTH domain